MSLKALLKDWLPPIVLRGLAKGRSRLWNGRHRDPSQLPEWEYVPGGWDACQTSPGGWDQPGVAETYASKWNRFVDLSAGTRPLGINHELPDPGNDCLDSHNQVMTLAYVVGRLARQRQRLQILDFGGALGHHLRFLQVLYPDLAIEYSCCELHKTASQGQRLHPHVRYVTDDVWSAQTFDLVMASNSVQYIRDWRAMLARLAGAATFSLLITKLPVVLTAPPFVILQRAWRYGYRTEYQGWCLNQADFLATAQLNGLRLTREFMVSRDDPAVPLAPEKPRSKGYLFDKIGSC